MWLSICLHRVTTKFMFITAYRDHVTLLLGHPRVEFGGGLVSMRVDLTV